MPTDFIGHIDNIHSTPISFRAPCVHRGYAVFPPCEPSSHPNPSSLLQKFLYRNIPGCVVKQHRTCIKFSRSASVRHVVRHTPGHLLYARLDQLMGALDALRAFMARHDHTIGAICASDIHFFDGVPVLINPNVVVARIAGGVDDTNRYLGTLLREVVALYSDACRSDPITPISPNSPNSPNSPISPLPQFSPNSPISPISPLPQFSPMQRFIDRHAPPL